MMKPTILLAGLLLSLVESDQPPVKAATALEEARSIVAVTRSPWP